MSPGEFTVRRFQDADEEPVVALLAESLGWATDDLHTRFFRWKHRENPFGPSPGWVAVTADGTVVGFRTFLRWELEEHGRVFRAVRAVDTATAPSHRGQGVFSSLTRHALDALAGEGVDFVFNTPNAQSRGGYLKLGWEPAGRLQVRARPASIRAPARMLRARAPAALWGEPVTAGEPAAEVLGDAGAVASLLAGQPADKGLRTRRTPAFLAWRYGFEEHRYRALLAGAGVADGLALFRVRRRGAAREAVVCDVVVPGGEAGPARDLLRRVVRRSGADYALRLHGAGLRRDGFVPVPGQGPALVWRGVCETRRPGAEEWGLVLGDVELF